VQIGGQGGFGRFPFLFGGTLLLLFFPFSSLGFGFGVSRLGFETILGVSSFFDSSLQLWTDEAHISYACVCCVCVVPAFKAAPHPLLVVHRCDRSWPLNSLDFGLHAYLSEIGPCCHLR
jgi:hypothetical protein